MEGLALTGAWTDPDKGLLSMIVLEMGVELEALRLAASGRGGRGDGPDGRADGDPEHETVLLAGGGLGNAVLFSIARHCARRLQGDLLRGLQATPRTSSSATTSRPHRSGDLGDRRGPRDRAATPAGRAFVGNIVQAMLAYAEGKLGPQVAPLSDVKRIIAIGSDRMMAAVPRRDTASCEPHLRASTWPSAASTRRCSA
jgi:hypothetical protein